MNNTLLKGPLPYNYERDFEASGYSFGFVTLQKVRYIISFKPTDYLFENVPDLKWKTYEFIISPVFIPLGIKPKKDERIPVTVAAIFYSFYKELPNDVVIYICDSSDRKERIRERLFNSWYYDFKKDEPFMKLDIALDPKQPDRIDFCVIMKLDNPHKFDIIYSLEKFKADVESDK
jgi:hypothetical protein